MRISRLIFFSLCLFLVTLIFVLRVIFPVLAEVTGGYPYASYNGPGSNPARYEWVGPNGKKYSEYLYYYRNCTDYAAWKLVSLGVPSAKVKGLSHGGKWAAAASKKGLTVNKTPGVWAAAVQPPTSGNKWGHVAFVEEVHTDGSIKIGEYNFASRGSYGTRSGKPADLGFTEFVHFGIAPSAPQKVSFVKSKKAIAPDGTPQVYSATKRDIYETWWRANSGVRTAKIAQIESIQDIDKVAVADGTQLVYAVTADGVWETWWRPGVAPHTTKIIELAGTKKIIAQMNGNTHLLYVLANDGPYEFWWRDGGDGIHKHKLCPNLDNPIAIVKATGPRGEQQLYTATTNGVYETWWYPGAGTQTARVITITQNNVVDVDKQTVDGTQLLYTATTGGVWETWWRGGSIGHGYIVRLDGTRDIQKALSGSIQQLYVASSGEVREYAWLPGKTISSFRVVGTSPIISIDKTVAGGTQQLYTTTNQTVIETWWDYRGLFTTKLLGVE